jgi:hypothetical protein
MYCSECGIKNLDKARFCFSCGHDLSEAIIKYMQFMQHQENQPVEQKQELTKTSSSMEFEVAGTNKCLLGNWVVPELEIPLPTVGES